MHLLHAAVLTIIILKGRLFLHHWQGLMLIAVGAFVVGLSSMLHSNCPPPTHHSHLHPHHDYPGYYSMENDSSTLSEADYHGAGALLQSMRSLLAASHTSGHTQDSKCSEAPQQVLYGNLLVLSAQIFSALQYVIEEKYVKQYRMPALLAVGLEGFWGLILSCAYLPLFQNLRVCSPHCMTLLQSCIDMEVSTCALPGFIPCEASHFQVRL